MIRVANVRGVTIPSGEEPRGKVACMWKSVRPEACGGQSGGKAVLSASPTHALPPKHCVKERHL
jgi:hypothetical protein